MFNNRYPEMTQNKTGTTYILNILTNLSWAIEKVVRKSGSPMKRGN